MSTDKNNLVYQEQLDDNVIEMLSEDIGSNYSLRTENTRAVVGALNEIKGKDIISNAVGSPLVFDDTFEVMGEKINGLTNDFKTKLLTLGVSISSIDKFETLIGKLDEIDLGVDTEDLLGSFIESLSGILEDEGVELSGNETLGELIVKTDEEFDRKNANAGYSFISGDDITLFSKATSYTYGGLSTNKTWDLCERYDCIFNGTVKIKLQNYETNYHYYTIYQYNSKGNLINTITSTNYEYSTSEFINDINVSEGDYINAIITYTNGSGNGRTYCEIKCSIE